MIIHQDCLFLPFSNGKKMGLILKDCELELKKVNCPSSLLSKVLYLSYKSHRLLRTNKFMRKESSTEGKELEVALLSLLRDERILWA